MSGKTYSIGDLFRKEVAAGVQRPADRFLRRTIFLTHLLQAQSAALESVEITGEAARLMRDRHLSPEQVFGKLSETMSNPLLQHLTKIPPGMKLQLVATRPVPSQIKAQQDEIYERYRPKYIKWLARNFPDQIKEAGIDTKGLKQMRRGITPPGWSVEHIEARHWQRDTQHKNILRNLILMRTRDNTWASHLECMQMSTFSPTNGWKGTPEFMLCVVPEKGPAHRVFVMNTSPKTTLLQETVNRLTNTPIGDLPRRVEGAAPPVIRTPRRPIMLGST